MNRINQDSYHDSDLLYAFFCFYNAEVLTLLDQQDQENEPDRFLHQSC